MSDAVPSGWQLEDFGKLARVQNGFAFKSSDFSDTGYAAAIRMSNLKLGRIDLSDTKYVKESILRGLDRFKLREGDFLFGMSGSLDNYAWIRKQDGLCYLNQRVGSLRAQPNTDPLFASYCYLSEQVKHQIVGLAAGAAQLNISSSQLESIQVLIPSLNEQKKIASILSSVDNVIETISAQINKLKDLKTGMMQELLTNGIGHTEFKDSPVGRIPSDWSVKEIQEIAIQVKPGPFGSSLTKSMYVESGYKVYGQEQVISGNFSVGDYFIDKDKYEELSAFQLRAGDILMSLVGTFGQVVRVPEEFQPGVINPRLLKLRFPPKLCDPSFMVHQLQSEFVLTQLKRFQQGGTMGVLSATTVKPVQLVIPPLHDQIKIGCTLNAISSAIVAKKHKLSLLVLNKKALMQDLLTGKVRVNLNQKETAAA